MRVSNANCLFVQLGDVNECYRVAAEIGYDAIDLSVTDKWNVGQINKNEYSEFFAQSDEDIFEYYRPYKEAAHANGMTIHQMHAPFPSMRWGQDELNERIHDAFEKTIKLSRFLDCRYVVAHPVYVDACRTEEEDLKVNFDLFVTYADLLRETGVVLCIENAYYYYRGRIISCSGSNSSFLVRLVEELNRAAGAECYGLCYDVGHANITGKDHYQEITAYGDHLKVLHIHDTDGTHDTHLIPYTARYLDRQGTDWEGMMKALARINFCGCINFESDGGVNGFPLEVKKDALRLNASIGKYFAARIEKYKQEQA